MSRLPPLFHTSLCLQLVPHCRWSPFSLRRSLRHPRLRRSCPRIAIAPRIFPLRPGMVAGEAYHDLGMLYCLKYCRPDSILLVCDRIDSNSCSAFFPNSIEELLVLLFISLVCYPNRTYKKVEEKLQTSLRVPWVRNLNKFLTSVVEG